MEQGEKTAQDREVGPAPAALHTSQEMHVEEVILCANRQNLDEQIPDRYSQSVLVVHFDLLFEEFLVVTEILDSSALLLGQFQLLGVLSVEFLHLFVFVFPLEPVVISAQVNVVAIVDPVQYAGRGETTRVKLLR